MVTARVHSSHIEEAETAIHELGRGKERSRAPLLWGTMLAAGMTMLLVLLLMLQHYSCKQNIDKRVGARRHHEACERDVGAYPKRDRKSKGHHQVY